jgi:hypothetical protein
MAAVRMVLLMTAPSPFAAQVLVARLGAEGILWELRGQSSVYPVGQVDVLVEEDAIARARSLVADPAADPGEQGLDGEPDDGAVPAERPLRTALAIVSLIVLAGIGLRLVAWAWM